MRPNSPGDRSAEPAPLATGPRSVGETDGDTDRTPTVAELRLAADDLALGDAFAEQPALTLHVETVATSRPTQPFSFVWVGTSRRTAAETSGNGGTEDAPDDVGVVLDALRADPSVVVRSVLTQRADTALCELSFCDHVSLVADVITSRNGTILTADASGAEWSLRVRYPHREALAETVSTLDRFDVETRLSQIGCRSGSAAADLTEKQRETIAVAFEEGYFEIPRQVSLEDLASELDVTHQALSERLRRAEQALLRSEFGE